MDSIKWKCGNWIVHFKKFGNFYLIHLIVEKLDVFNDLSVLISTTVLNDPTKNQMTQSNAYILNLTILQVSLILFRMSLFGAAHGLGGGGWFEDPPI